MIKKKIHRIALWSGVVLLASASIATIGFSAWQAHIITNDSGVADEALYSIVYHHDGTTEDGPTGLELTSGFDMPILPTTQAHLLAGKFYFAGWALGTSDAAPTGTPTVFNNSVNHSVKDIVGGVPEDSTIHLWESWTTTVKSTDVVFDITYNTSSHYRTLVGVTDRFYLFNINLPVENKYVTKFTYGSGGSAREYDPNDSLDLTNATLFPELGSGEGRIINLTATLSN